MKSEHIAFNHRDPVAAADWYVRHLGLRIVSRQAESPWMIFLADDSGTTLFEIYNNPRDPAPDYFAQHPLRFHLAFVSADPAADRARLEAAGCSFFEEITTPSGSYIVMLRDPWGVPLQLCRRVPAFFPWP